MPLSLVLQEAEAEDHTDEFELSLGSLIRP